MLRFVLIGSIDLRRDDGKEIDQLLRQPKRLALLAYLASPAPGTWHRRDTLLGIFWPELDASHARTALRNALYVLRNALGDGVVLARGDEEVAIDAASMTTDLAALWDAIREERATDALALYRGELLPGLYPADSEGFLPWLDGQRARLRAEVARIGAAHVEELAHAQRTGDALRVAMRVLEVSPDDEVAVRRLLELHERTGDRGSGLVLYERFVARLRDEYGAEPSAQTAAAADRLRRPNRYNAAPATPRDAPAAASGPVARARARRASPALIMAGLVVLVVVFVGSVVAGGARRAAQIGRAVPVTAEEGLQIQPALSPDGRLVAFARGDPHRMRIWVKRVDGGPSWALTPDSATNELVPRWSPQSDQILFLSQNHAWVSAAVGGRPRLVAAGIDSDRSVRSASWSPRGDSVAFVRNDSLQVKPLDGPGSRFVGTGRQLHSCVWSPDGQWIACTTGNWISFVPGPLFGNRAPSGIVLFRASGGAAIALTDEEHEYQSPSWSPDSRELWVLSNRDGPSGEAYAIRVSRDGRAARAPARIGLNAQWISLGSRRVAYSVYSRFQNVWFLPIPGNPSTVLEADDATRFTSGHRIIEIMTVSRDGQWLVYDSNERGNTDIYRMPLGAAGGPAERLTDDRREEFVGVLSPDGTELLYHLWVGGERRLRVKRLADGFIEEPLASPGDQSSPQWSPDGRAIAFWSHENESGVLMVVRRNADGIWAPPRWRLPDAQLPVWSPDGKDLAFVTRTGTIELIAADSGPRRLLYAPRSGTSDPMATNVVWEANREFIWFIGHNPAGASGIWTLPLRGGQPRKAINLVTKRGASNGPVFASDGARIYFALDERVSNVWYAELVK